MIALLLVACAPGEPALLTTGFEAMGTRVELTVAADEADVVDHVRAVFSEVEASANEWRPGSPLAEVNDAAGGDAVPVPPETLALVRRGLAFGEQTDGAFDVSWAALWGLWDFSDPVVPDPAEVSWRAALVDWRRVEVGEGTVRLPERGMALGLGGIAKGWALDRSVAVLRDAGIEVYALSAGGQLAVGGREWSVGLRDPRGTPDEWFGVVSLSQGSVSTSGDYEQFFELDGVRYHHVLDPRTGWPARGVRSATVVAPDATSADALSTALMVMGIERGLALVASLSGTEAVIVDDAGVVHASDGVDLAVP